MASQRTPEQLKSIILKATQHLVAAGGMQNFSYPKLAAETGINAPTVYEHYKNKEALLTTCFLTIDNEIACKIANAPKSLSAGVKDLHSLVDLCWLLWLGVYHVVWGSSVKSKSSGQIEQLMLKHPYQLENGREDFMGFVGRFGGNSKLYLSKHFAITGFKDADSRETSTPLTVLYYLIFAAAMVRAYRCNRFVFFAGLHVAVMLAVTFVVLQVLWAQYRLMIIYLPLMMMLELYGVYAIVRYVLGGGVAVGVAGLLLFIGGCSSVGNSLDRIDLMCLRSNLMGDKFVGYTPDWVNYLTACEYAGTTLGPDECAACRKPNMARIYANGKKFYGIYSFDTEDADELLRRLSDNGVTHVILGSMRRDPLVNDGTIINTLHRYVAYVAQKYPDAFQLVRTFGTADTEPAYLLRVRYDAAGMTYPNTDPDNAKKD